ncbi:hypothetical protein [Romboutsia sp.]|uniref:hypothetical protein n=1 Tax=Romboutsia sp. TaxID=1965302 RepID=UPI003F3A4055
MANKIRARTLYSGISDYIPCDINSFTQQNKNTIITIHEDLPDIDEIIKVGVTSNIKDNKIVKTGIGKSLEGEILTGYKLLTEGEFIVRIDFCADNERGSIYTFKNFLFFNNSTTLDENINLNSKVMSSIYIEDVYAQKINQREILANISFILTAENY